MKIREGVMPEEAYMDLYLMHIRPTRLRCVDWLLQANFKITNKEISLPPYHYGIFGIKTSNKSQIKKGNISHEHFNSC